MVNLGLFLFLLFSVHCMPEMAETVVASNSNPSGTNFIRISCKATLYPVLCFQSLSRYATKIQQNELDLAQAALSVSLTKAQLTKMFISRMIKAPGIKSREYRALIDCIDNMGDTVNQLNRSIKELNRMKLVRGQGFMWHMSNVLTWVSAALTNENTCVDGFSGNLMEGNVKGAIKSQIIAVSQVTSNSLALVNRFAARHRGAAAAASNIP